MKKVLAAVVVGALCAFPGLAEAKSKPITEQRVEQAVDRAIAARYYGVQEWAALECYRTAPKSWTCKLGNPATGVYALINAHVYGQTIYAGNIYDEGMS